MGRGAEELESAYQGLHWPSSEGSVPSYPQSIVSGFTGQEVLTDTFSIISLPV